MALSRRAERALRPADPDGFYPRALEVWYDVYHPEKNRSGYINLAIAQNALSTSLLADKLASVPPMPAAWLYFSDWRGCEEMRSVVADFLQRYVTKTPVSLDDVAVLNGAASVINRLSCLLCNEHEHVIVCGPGYRGLSYELATHADADLTIANLEEDQNGSHIFPPNHSIPALQRALDRARSNGHVVRAVLIVSPHNPTGEVLSPSLIRDIVAWTRANNLHAIFDELYALSVFDQSVKHNSVSEVLGGDLSDDVHIVWSMTKDLCGIGLCVGVLYSQNKRLVQACERMYARFSATSKLMQWKVTNILADFEWLDRFIAENQRRLRESYDLSVAQLKQLRIPYVPASSGFFIFADFRRFMLDETKEAELELWNRMADGQVVFTPSSDILGSKYGFFRICFAAVPLSTLDIAWSNLRNVLQDNFS